MFIWSMFMLGVGYVAGAYWSKEVKNFFGNIIRKITNR